MKVKIKKVHPLAEIPKYQSAGAAGFDLSTVEDFIIYPTQTILISTGLVFQIPEGYELQIRPRSGLSFKTSLRVANSPGTIDSDYTGEVKIILENTSPCEQYSFDIGDRIAQGVIAPVIQAEFELVDEVDETERGAGGFGHTGK